MPEHRFRRREPGKVLNEPVLGFNKIEFIRHALDQMAIRGVSVHDVLRTIRKPTKEGLPTEAGRKRVRWHRTARSAIDVVYEELPDRLRVITVIAKIRRIVERH